jgi:ubiquinone/menaquinone biosynthesis C-methylase UbiE
VYDFEMSSNDDSRDRVREYYAQFGDREWLRLCNAEDGAIEFAVTCHALATHLPKSGRVLDIGGGPGRYTIWLAQRGYRVALADLSPNLLDIARAKIAEAGAESNVESIGVADARHLKQWPDDSFDAVLSLGPFYHLPELRDRRAATAEMVRVLRPGGIAFVAQMPSYSFLRRTIAIQDERRHLLQPEWLMQLTERGYFENDIAGRFDHGFGVRPAEIIPFFDEFGIEALTLLAAESLSIGIQRPLAELSTTDPDAYAVALNLMIEAAADPSIHGLSNHLIYVGRRR